MLRPAMRHCPAPGRRSAGGCGPRIEPSQASRKDGHADPAAKLVPPHSETMARPASWDAGEGATVLSSHQEDGTRPATRWTGADGERRHMGQTARFQETLRRLAMIDEGFVEDEAGLGLAWPRRRPWIPRPRRCCKWRCWWPSRHWRRAWNRGAPPGAGRGRDQAGDRRAPPPAIAPVAGLGWVVSAAPAVAIALRI